MLAMNFRRLLVIAASISLATPAAAPAFAQPSPAVTKEPRPKPTAADIAKWVGELNDDRYLVREQATRHLLVAGEAALDELLVAADGERPEPADRSIWILRRQSMSKDPSLRRQGLEHLARLKKRPQVAAAARETLAQIEHEAALEAIEQRGGRYVDGEFPVQVGPIATPGLVLDERWQGGDEGLERLRHLVGLRHVIIIGTTISAEGAKQLQHCKSLQQVWLYGTRLQPSDVENLRKLLPEQVLIDYRRGALLGVGRTAGSDTTGPAIVNSVSPGSAAAAAGIQPKDVIQKFNGEPIPNFKALTSKIADHHPGDEVALEVLRNDKAMEIKVKLGQWKTVD
jgi:hypothetical protein